MNEGSGLRCSVLLTALLVALTSCAPPGPGSPGSDREGGRPRSGPKTLTVGLLRGLPDFSPFTAMSLGSSARAIDPMVSDGLTYLDHQNVAHPLKAAELPSLERGTWKLFDDGAMEVTWRLRPNIVWHDGQPQTTQDYAFQFEVDRDRELPRSIDARTLAQTRLSFPDPQTIVVHWSAPYVDAGTAGPAALPKHILEEAYRQDKLGAFINHPYWTHEYVGDGPYRIARWELGADMDLERHDLYYLGRPPFDKVFIRVIGDPQTLISNILAGTLDIVIPPGVELDAALEVKRRWEGTGNEVRPDVNGRIIHFEVQFRPEVARPQFGLTEQPVRQALYQAINRQALAEFMTHGFGPLADSWYRPEEPRRAELAIPQFAYDPSAAPALLAKAGWTRRGPDGLLVHERTGEPFRMEIWANVAAGWDKLGYAVAEDWKPLGVEAQVHPIPASRTGDREYESHHTSVFVTNVNEEQFLVNRLHSERIPSAETRWVGNNRGGYRNPEVDALYDRLVVTIEPRDRTAIERELVRIVIGGLVMMPFYWEVLPVLKRKGVKDHKFRTGQNTWFFFDWDKE